MGIPDHLTCLLRNFYASQEATVKTKHGTTEWFQIVKKYIRAVYCHSAWLIYICTVHHVKCQADEAQAGIKIAGRYTSNLRYTDDTTLMEESEQEFKAS